MVLLELDSRRLNNVIRRISNEVAGHRAATKKKTNEIEENMVTLLQFYAIIKKMWWLNCFVRALNGGTFDIMNRSHLQSWMYARVLVCSLAHPTRAELEIERERRNRECVPKCFWFWSVYLSGKFIFKRHISRENEPPTVYSHFRCCISTAFFLYIFLFVFYSR